ncbi:MAG: hypothetical protein J7L19_00210 [Dehalococcoidia bacterium]|nr:hypothetical protein [Dehalococcoidia bacterium]
MVSSPEQKDRQTSAGDSTTSLKLNVAGLLCYVGTWVTGIVFLIIEKKNVLVRFHAMQSLVTFGILHIVVNIANAVRLTWLDGGWGVYPFLIGSTIVYGALLAIGIILWIILMHRTYHGQLVNVPLSGDLALKLLIRLDGISEEDFQREAGHLKTEAEVEQPSTPLAEGNKQPSDTGDRYFKSTRTSRIASSGVAIAWSAVLLIFFNLFNQYIAFYQSQTINGVTQWNIYVLLTQDFRLVLPILNATLILSIIGHTIAIIFDKYLLREIISIVLNSLGVATVLTFLRVFPFDFSVIPDTAIAAISPTVVIVALVATAVALGIVALVKLIMVIINVSRALPTVK